MFTGKEKLWKKGKKLISYTTTTPKTNLKNTAKSTKVSEGKGSNLPYVLKMGLKNNKYVKTVQKQLKKKVKYTGYQKGNYGTKTALYVKKFQKAKKLPQTGKVDNKTWKALIK